MTKPVVVYGRYRMLGEFDAELQRLRREVHLSRRVSGSVYALRGVATNELDIVVTDDFDSPLDTRDIRVVEVARKSGKYDGKERDRLLFRRMPDHQAKDFPQAEVYLLGEGTAQVEVVVEGYDAVEDADRRYWVGTYRLWTDRLEDPEKAGDVMLWHWRRYYSFLCETEVRSAVKSFTATVIEQGLNLAEANRFASRELYSMARAAGYRKLTLREQVSWGLNGQWHKQEAVAEARLSRSGRHGCGEQTTLSATMAVHLDGWVDQRTEVQYRRLRRAKTR